MVHGLERTISGYPISGGRKVPKKELGQHWLKDPAVLSGIADSIFLAKTDTVLEVGPGLGTLTSALLKRCGKVLAVEYDTDLARKLPGQFPGKNLEVVNADFLLFDLSILPMGYKVVANIPYYITQKIVERFILSDNQPYEMALLVQKEVAEKLAAVPGDMTAIAVKTQFYYDVQLSTRVPKEYFTPPPKVDSQVVICKKRHVVKNEHIDERALFRVVNAGFSSPRKKLYTALSGGLAMTKDSAKALLLKAGVQTDSRASDVSILEWLDILKAYDSL